MSPDDPFATSPFFFTTRKRESLFVRVLQTWGLRVDSWKPCFARTGSSKFVTLSSLLLRSLSLSVLIIVFVLLFQFKVQFSDEFRLLLIHFMLFHFWSIWSSVFFFFFENNLNCLYWYLICFSIEFGCRKIWSIKIQNVWIIIIFFFWADIASYSCDVVVNSSKDASRYSNSSHAAVSLH